MKTPTANRFLSLILFAFFYTTVAAQEAPAWDNQAYFGNKVAFGRGKYKFSGELQTRLENNFQSLDNWFLEFVSSYLLSEKIEIVPDFRFTVKPDRVEYRPALGVLYKSTTEKLQFVNQVKWQSDIDNLGEIGHAVREVVFLNYISSPKMIVTLVSGFIYRWRPQWNGFQYIRVGPGFSYVFDKVHVLNFSYFVGVENNTREWMWAGIPMIQLVINITKKYTYVPAYYFSF